MFNNDELTIIKNVAISKEIELKNLKNKLSNFECYKEIYKTLEQEIELHKSIKDKCNKMLLENKDFERAVNNE